MKKCVSVIGAAMLFGWTAAAEEVPKVETFLGYTYLRTNPTTDVSSFGMNGGSGQFVYNFSRWFSGVLDVGAVNNNNIGGFRIDNTALNFLAGPRLSLHKSRITPYIQALFGGVYYTASSPIDGFAAGGIALPNPVLRPGDPVTGRFNTAQTVFGMAIGGGVELKVSRHVRFRPIAADYFMTRLQNVLTQDHNYQNNFRYSTGFTFLFGGEHATPAAPQHAPAPATKTCWNGVKVLATAACPKQDLTLTLVPSQTEICAGETAQVNASLNGGGAGNGLNYVWSVNGQPVSQGHTFAFGSAGMQPGAYRISLKVSGANFNPAIADTSIVVREYRPPAGTVQANPAEIFVGEKSTLSASFQGQCGGPIQAPAFAASEGSLQGDKFECTAAMFDPASNAEQRKTVTITASAADNKGVGTATTTVACVRKATVAAIRLPDVLFQHNDARVNNCGKRVLLEELRAYVQRDPTGTVVLVGHTSSDETAAGLDMRRTMNAAAVITAGSGVCLSVPQSQVQLNATGVDQNGVGFETGFCGPSVSAGSSTAANMRRVEVWFVPTGGQMPASLTKSQAASSLPVSALGCPK